MRNHAKELGIETLDVKPKRCYGISRYPPISFVIFERKNISGPSLFHSVREECLNRSIPIVHASTKRLLSRAVQRFPYTNIVAVFGFQGFEVEYHVAIDRSSLQRVL